MKLSPSSTFEFLAVLLRWSCPSHISVRQANARLQSELDSNTISFDAKLAASASAAAAEREQLRHQVETLTASLKEQVVLPLPALSLCW